MPTVSITPDGIDFDSVDRSFEVEPIDVPPAPSEVARQRIPALGVRLNVHGVSSKVSCQPT